MDRDAGAEGRDVPREVGDGRAVQVGAAGDVLCVHRNLVSQHRVGRVVGAHVLHGDRVPQGLPGLQYRGVTREIVRDLLHLEDRSGLDQNPRRIFIARNQRIRRSVHVRIIADEERSPTDPQLGLIRRVGARRDHRSERDFELHHHRVALVRKRQVANIDGARALRTAGAAGVARVGTSRHRDQLERARLEKRGQIQTIDLVVEREVCERDGAEVLDLESIPEYLARARGDGRVRAGGHVQDRLLEAELRQRGNRREGILVIEHANGPVGQGARVLPPIGTLGAEPLRRTGDVGERDTVLRVRIEFGLVRDE
jgi:hypothetical protein